MALELTAGRFALTPTRRLSLNVEKCVHTIRHCSKLEHVGSSFSFLDVEGLATSFPLIIISPDQNDDQYSCGYPNRFGDLIGKI